MVATLGQNVPQDCFGRPGISEKRQQSIGIILRAFDKRLSDACRHLGMRMRQVAHKEYVSVASGERLSGLAGAASSPASIVIIVILLRASAFASTEGEGP